jgi:S1-C subfamily serine protease
MMSEGFARQGADSSPGPGEGPGPAAPVPPYPADLIKACWQLSAGQPAASMLEPGPHPPEPEQQASSPPPTHAGPGTAGSGTAGLETAGLETAGPETAGPGTGLGTTEPGLGGLEPAERGPEPAAPAAESASEHSPAQPFPDDYLFQGRTPKTARRPGGSRLTAIIVGTALTAALAGGLVGGYIESRASSAGTDPGFSVGTVPPIVTNRPPDSVAGIASRVLPSVVMIKVNGAQGTGSGFVIKGGYIITDNHVITLDGQVRNAALEVVLDGGKVMPAKVIGADPYSDIAVIKPQGGIKLPELALGNSTSVRVGDPVIAFGSPLGLAGTVTSGIVSALSRPVQPSNNAGVTHAPQVFFEAIQTDAPINPGNSGGPLVNGQAQVIGINSAIDTLGGNPLTGSQGGSIGLGFAIPINQARLVATQLIRTGRAAHAVIGALINQSYTGAGAQISAPRKGSPAAVSPGGPAGRAGLRSGDVITGFGGQRIENATALLDAIRSLAPGARVVVTFTRNGIQHSATLTLGSAES